MSIWCSQETIGFDTWNPRQRKPRGGQVRSYATGWSNHYPTTDGKVERRAGINLATIAPWCVPGHEELAEYGDERACGPWLRLDVTSWEHNFRDPSTVSGEQSAGVVIDEGAATSLVAQLTNWLDRPKTRPKKAT